MEETTEEWDTLGVKCRVTLKNTVKRFADERGRKMSEVGKTAIEEYLSKYSDYVPEASDIPKKAKIDYMELELTRRKALFVTGRCETFGCKRTPEGCTKLLINCPPYLAMYRGK